MSMSKIKMAALGDSLAQGFQSGAICNTEWSFPAIVARTFGCGVPTDFRVPKFGVNGLPLNIEQLLYRMQFKLGSNLGPEELALRAPVLVADFLDEVEDYFERGRGSRPKFGGNYHNLAVWGFALAEATRLRVSDCDAAIDETEGWIEDDFLGLPSGAMYRTARAVLNPSGDTKRKGDTQIRALERLLTHEGPLDVLIVWLGANDALGTVLTLEVNDMTDAKKLPRDPVELLAWNLTSEAEFARDYAELSTQISDILARLSPNTKVFVGNVPHVTIPPISRGQGNFRDGYFDYYTRFFVPEGTLPLGLEKLTREEAMLIDTRIDAFNKTIEREVETRKDWHLVDTCGLLGSLAVRRQGHDNDPGEPLRAYYQKRGQGDHPLLELDPIPSISMYRMQDGKRTQGGLMSLDGVHPSTIGYGLIAEHFLEAMKAVGVANADPRNVPWQTVIAADWLQQHPPVCWEPLMTLGERYASFWAALTRAMA
jgi:lysophospholipase L1-like esterase